VGLARQAHHEHKTTASPVPFSSSHTYLLAIAELKLSVDHSGSAALHSADRSWINSPSGALAGQFLLVFTSVVHFSLILFACEWVEEEIELSWCT
jgi:hypothetical protein